MSRGEQRGPEVPKEMVRAFSERIAKSLEEEPFELEVVEHRRRVGRLLQTAEGATHYELLEVGSGSSASEVQTAFLAVGRLVHPRHEARLGLPGLGKRLEVLVARVTEAYLVLSDPDRCRAYTRSLPEPPPSHWPRQNDESRRRERQKLGREQYQRAVTLEAEGDHFTAIQLAEQAALIDPRAEYFEFLGRCQERNPSWIGRAVTSYERALELEPGRRDLRERVQDLHQERGDIVSALAQKEVLQGAPPPARSRGVVLPASRPPRRGILGRLVGRLGRWLASLDR